MTRILAILLACLLYSSSAIAGGRGLDEFLHNLNVQAQANREGFSATLSSQFHVSGTEVEVVLGSVHDPADAFMVLQLGQMSRRPTAAVLSVYQNHAERGWGAIAQAPRPPRTTTTGPATDAASESVAPSRAR
jgi:hypothetical protein